MVCPSKVYHLDRRGLVEKINIPTDRLASVGTALNFTFYSGKGKRGGNRLAALTLVLLKVRLLKTISYSDIT